MAADFKCLTINPEQPDGPRIDAVFPAALTLKYFKYAPTRYMNLIAAKFVLENPEFIFFGIREFNEGGWCYSGHPSKWYVTSARMESFPDDLVYTVYLNPNMRVYECRAEENDSDDPKCPKGWKNRYRGMTWKSTSWKA